jgi:RNA-binding protein PNO1
LYASCAVRCCIPAGIGGKTKFAIENATRTRIIVADSKIHILGMPLPWRGARCPCASLLHTL